MLLNSGSERVFIFSSHLLDKRVLPRAARPGDEAAGRSGRRRGLREAVREVRHLQVRQQILRLPAQVIPIICRFLSTLFVKIPQNFF